LSRPRQSRVKLVAALKNLDGELLIDAGFKAPAALSELYGAAGRLVMAGLTTRNPGVIRAIVKNTGRRLKAPMKALSDALEGMTPLLVARLQDALAPIDSKQARIARLNSLLYQGLGDAGRGVELERSRSACWPASFIVLRGTRSRGWLVGSWRLNRSKTNFRI
jgi:hypothetical protein